jgi:hypothetical protein
LGRPVVPDHVLEAVGVLEGVEDLEQRFVDDQRAVLGVAGDEPELVGVKARVQRMDHRAH